MKVIILSVSNLINFQILELNSNKQWGLKNLITLDLKDENFKRIRNILYTVLQSICMK
jgi:hypothetical protein